MGNTCRKRQKPPVGRPSGGSFLGGASCLDKVIEHLYIEAWLQNRVSGRLTLRTFPGGTYQNDIRSLRLIERASDRESTFREDVGIDHRRPDVAVAQQLLDGTDIVAHFQQSGCEGVPKRMTASVLCDP